MKGTISIDCGFEGTVTAFMKTDDSIKASFQGYNAEYGQYVGEFQATLTANKYYLGNGHILYTADNTIVYANLTLVIAAASDVDVTVLTGEWRDHGDPENYPVEIEIPTKVL